MSEQLKYVMVPVADLKPNPQNPRKHPDKQIKQIMASIQEHGFLVPLLIDENNMLITGHGRLEAAKRLGRESVPCVIESHLTEAQRLSYTIADNRLAELSSWDKPLVGTGLAKIAALGADVTLTGFGKNSLPAPVMTSGSTDPDDVPLAPAEPKAKRGQIWQLGAHRLMCGSSTDEADVRKLMDGVTVEMILTDPPYCSGGFQESGRSAGSIGTDAKNKRTIANDTLSTRGYVSLIRSVLGLVPEALAAYVFTDWRMWVNLFDVVESSGFGVRNMIVWDKGTPGMGVGWRCQHELCMFALRTKAKFDNHKAVGNVIQCKRTGNELHPTQKPVELIESILGVTDWLHTVYDPFGGSGTTLIACQRLGRTCYTMELEPAFCDTIIARWEQLTGQKAELIHE